jgi:hypothetical protein
MGGIGTRRWAKFSKYLANLGYEVHILTSLYPYIDDNNWENDINHENIIIHKFKTFYPVCLTVKSKYYVINNIKRILNYILHKTIFYLDNAQYDAKNILTSAKQIIANNNIKNVIATGHPVSINYIATYLKIDNSDINLIQDYRDNWNDLNVYQYGNKGGLSFFKQKEQSVYKEFLTIFYSDVIINVSGDLTKKSQKKHKSLSDKFITITNGFDPEEFKGIKISQSYSDIEVIYAGSLYNHRIDAIYLLLDALIDLDNSILNEKLKIIIYSNYDTSRFKQKYRYLINKNIFFNDFIPPKDILKIIAKTQYCLSINSRFASYAFGTKIFDYMALNKQIIHISNGGSLYNLLDNSNNFAVTYDIIQIKNVLLKIKDTYLNDDENIKSNEQFDINTIIKKLEKCLK